MVVASPLLGAIIAGGRAQRFGRDKGAALLGGISLIDHIAAALRPQVDKVIVVGRAWPGLDRVDDAPHAGLGPLCGLSGALIYAAEQGYSAVLTAGCDTFPVPQDLVAQLGSCPAVIENHYLFGLWPVSLAKSLSAHIAQQSDHSLRYWIACSGARQIPVQQQFANLNTEDDLSRYSEILSSS